MQNKLKQIILSVFLCCTNIFAHGQTDTLYIFEDIIVYDTIVIHDTVYKSSSISPTNLLSPKSISLLQLDTNNNQASLLLISGGQTATFSINHIILDENIKNLESMKKLNFFGVALFAFQTMVLAQTNYEVSIGSGIWWENGKLDYVKKPFSSLISSGIYAKRNFTKKNWGFKSGIEYSYLLGSKNYELDGTLGIGYSSDGSELEDINRNYGSGLHELSIPLLIYWDQYKIQSYLGLDFNLLFTGMQTSTNGFKYYTNSNNIGLRLGFGYKLNSALTINLLYKNNLTPDYQKLKSDLLYIIESPVLGNNYKLRNAQAKVSIVYTIKKKRDCQ